MSVLLLQLTVWFVMAPIAGELASAGQQGCSGHAIVGKRLNHQEKTQKSGLAGASRA